MRPVPIMRCAHQSLNCTCVASCSSLSLCVGMFLGAANSSSSTILSPPSSDILSRSSPTPFSPISSHRSTSFFSSCFISAQCCRPYKFVESGFTTGSPCQLKTGPVSSKPHVHCVRILFIQRDNVSSSNNLLHRNERFDNTRTSECYAPLNSLVFVLSEMICSPSSLICSPFAATNFFGDVLRPRLSCGNIVSSIT